MIDQDAPVRAVLSTFGPGARADLQAMAEGRATDFYRALITRSDLRRLTIWLVDSRTAEEARHRVLRAIDDLSEGHAAP